MKMNLREFKNALVTEDSRNDFEKKYVAIAELFSSGILTHPIETGEFKGRIMLFDSNGLSSDSDSWFMRAFEIGTVQFRSDGLMDVMIRKERTIAYKDGKFVHKICGVYNLVDATLGDYLLGPLFRNTKSQEKRTANEIAKKAMDSIISEKYPAEVFSRFKASKEEGIAVPISLRHILNPSYSTKSDILSIGGRRKLPLKSLNRYTLGAGLVLRDSQKLIPEDAFGRFTGKKNAEVLYNILKEIVEFSQREFIINALARFLYPTISAETAKDYLERCKRLGRFADVSIKNEGTMSDTIIEMKKDMGEYRNLNIATQFIHLAELLEPRYHLLRSTLDIEIEGRRQHNCVASYNQAVDSGECAIFTMKHEGKRYTIEIRSDDGFRFSCNQFKGFANEVTEESLRLEAELVAELDYINAASTLTIR